MRSRRRKGRSMVLGCWEKRWGCVSRIVCGMICFFGGMVWSFEDRFDVEVGA